MEEGGKAASLASEQPRDRRVRRVAQDVACRRGAVEDGLAVPGEVPDSPLDAAPGASVAGCVRRGGGRAVRAPGVPGDAAGRCLGDDLDLALRDPIQIAFSRGPGAAAPRFGGSPAPTAATISWAPGRLPEARPRLQAWARRPSGCTTATT